MFRSLVTGPGQPRQPGRPDHDRPGRLTPPPGLGLTYLIHFLGMLSINLAVLNFLPIPPLDGGQMVFLVAEKIRGRPLPDSALMRGDLLRPVPRARPDGVRHVPGHLPVVLKAGLTRRVPGRCGIRGPPGCAGGRDRANPARRRSGFPGLQAVGIYWEGA